MSYHLYSAIRHLFIWYHSHSWYLNIMFDLEVIYFFIFIHIWFFNGHKTSIQLLKNRLKYLVFSLD
jgi:hypothetical protein